MLSAVKAEGGLEIRIQDDGPGISDQDAERVFERFFRGESEQGKTAGSGLGLYMARVLAQAMDGSLELDNREASGCCFTLTLPNRA